MIDPNQPAFPVQHSIDGNWQKAPSMQYSGLTIRAEIASRLMAAMFANPAMSEVLPHIVVAAALGGTDLLIEKLNETT